MHAITLLHKTLGRSAPQIHCSRLNALMSGVDSLLAGRRLTLTALGRSSQGQTQVKNKIKKMDRLLGNKKLHNELDDCYKALAHFLISNKMHPMIIVDWASVDNRNKFHVLKASLAYEGRAITIYDQVEYKDRPKKAVNNSHDVFIDTLSKILPKGCQPIIIADAGFSVKWFKRIEAKGWYWVGRLRGLVKMKKTDTNDWESCSNMFKKASNIPTEMGEYIIGKKNPLVCRLYLYKECKKGRKRQNRDGSIKKCSPNADYKKAANEPWLLASNLSKSYTIAKKVVKYYKTRMQIEETFRDIKDRRYGLGIRETLSNCKKRVTVLLLIAALALLVFGALGHVGYKSGAYKHYQANTTTHRRVLSFWYLGQQIYEHDKKSIQKADILYAFSSIIEGIPDCKIV